MRRQQVYFVAKDNDHINFLGENGWDIFCKSPLVIAIHFNMADGPHLYEYKKRLEAMANESKRIRDFLIKKFKFSMKEIKSEIDPKGRKFVIDDWSPLFDWRLEFNYYEDMPMVYITFGPVQFDAPAIAVKEVIDKFVPSDILEKAIGFGSIYVGEVEIDDDNYA